MWNPNRMWQFIACFSQKNWRLRYQVARLDEPGTQRKGNQRELSLWTIYLQGISWFLRCTLKNWKAKKAKWTQPTAKKYKSWAKLQHAMVLGGESFQFRPPRRSPVRTSSFELRPPKTKPQSPRKDPDASPHTTPSIGSAGPVPAGMQAGCLLEDSNFCPRQGRGRYSVAMPYDKKKKFRRRKTLAGRVELRELQFCGGRGRTSLGGKS